MIEPMKGLPIFGLLVLTLNAFSQKSVEDPPGVLLHRVSPQGDGPNGTLRVTVLGADGKPASHVGVMVLWSCPEVCPIIESSMLTNSAGEFQLDPITVGRYLVCSNSDVESQLPCFMEDAHAPSCTVEITPEHPKVELHMQIPKREATRHEKALCRQTAPH